MRLKQQKCDKCDNFFAIIVVSDIWQNYVLACFVGFRQVLIGGLESGGRAVITSFLTVLRARRDVVNHGNHVDSSDYDLCICLFVYFYRTQVSP